MYYKSHPEYSLWRMLGEIMSDTVGAFPLKGKVIAVTFGQFDTTPVVAAPPVRNIMHCLLDDCAIEILVRRPACNYDESFRVEGLRIEPDAWGTPHVVGSVLQTGGFVRVQLTDNKAEADPMYYRP